MASQISGPCVRPLESGADTGPFLCPGLGTGLGWV